MFGVHMSQVKRVFNLSLLNDSWIHNYRLFAKSVQSFLIGIQSNKSLKNWRTVLDKRNDYRHANPNNPKKKFLSQLSDIPGPLKEFEISQWILVMTNSRPLSKSLLTFRGKGQRTNEIKLNIRSFWKLATGIFAQLPTKQNL